MRGIDTGVEMTDKHSLAGKASRPKTIGFQAPNAPTGAWGKFRSASLDRPDKAQLRSFHNFFDLRIGLKRGETICINIAYRQTKINAMLTQNMREVHSLCDEAGDVATASLLENWIDETEKRTWFLFECGQHA